MSTSSEQLLPLKSEHDLVPLCHPKAASSRAQKPRKSSPRSTFTQDELRTFEAYFEKNPLPSGEVLSLIAVQLGLRREVVRVWFQNRRAKLRKQSKTMSAAQLPLGVRWSQSPSGDLGTATNAGQRNDFSEEETTSCSPCWERLPADEPRVSAFVSWSSSRSCEGWRTAAPTALAPSHSPREGVATSDWRVTDGSGDSSSFPSPPGLLLHSSVVAGADIIPREVSSPLGAVHVLSSDNGTRRFSAERTPVYTSVIRAGPDYRYTRAKCADLDTHRHFHAELTRLAPSPSGAATDDGRTAASPGLGHPSSPASSSSGISSAGRSLALELSQDTKCPRLMSESDYSDCEISSAKSASQLLTVERLLPVADAHTLPMPENRDPRLTSSPGEAQKSSQSPPAMQPIIYERRTAQAVSEDEDEIRPPVCRQKRPVPLPLPLVQACVPGTYFPPSAPLIPVDVIASASPRPRLVPLP